VKTKDALKAGSVIRFEQDAPVRQPAAPEAAPATKRPRGLNIMRVAKIDPAKRRAAILPIKTDMRTIRKMVGRHVGEQLVTSIDNLQVPIWRVRGSLPVRGAAVLYGFAGYGPSDFPGSIDWLKRMIEFEPEGVERAINDKREEGDVPRED
jgi:hypothetical protein